MRLGGALSSQLEVAADVALDGGPDCGDDGVVGHARERLHLTLGHEEHLGDVVAGYGTDVDLDVIRAWWSLRSLRAVRWLSEHGFDPSSPGCEVDVLRSRL